MKHPLLMAGILVLFALPRTASAATYESGVTATSLGNQYVYIEPNNTTCVAPQYLYTGAGLLTQQGVTADVVYGTNNPEVVTEQVVNGDIATLSLSNNYATGGDFNVRKTTPTTVGGSPSCELLLAGNPPKNAAGVPLKADQYAYAATTQPVTYYVLVTGGTLKGDFFSVQGNTAKTLLIDTEGLSVVAGDITAVSLLPYWSLSSLFPPGQATVSFIPTTDPDNVMTKVVISPSVTHGSQQPQQVGKSYYFSAALGTWVSADNPSVPAGDTVIPPGAYVYVQNTGTGCYPLRVFLQGSQLTHPFRFFLSSSRNSSTTSFLSLPRNSPYSIGQIGFNDTNFTQSTGTGLAQRKDILIVDDGHGGVAAAYYRYNNRWYNTDSPVPVNPVFAPGTVFGVRKPRDIINPGDSLLLNRSNLK